ncbi:MAG: hypothetical protein HY907_19725 [Deltaproteobacteria bacterium]|nr:hypothetical protein [Deltaproteobacteria bacterium]
MRSDVKRTGALVSLIALLACGPSPGPAGPGVPPPDGTTPGAGGGAAPAGVEIPLPAPTGGPRDAAAFEIFAGPCAWTPGHVEGVPRSTAWRVEAPGAGSAIESLAYGTPPPGWTTTSGPKALEEGCWCILAEPCCDAQHEFEVRGGAVGPTCESWGSLDLPLPAGDLDAYLFTPGEREEHVWRVALGGAIRVLEGGFGEDRTNPIDEMEVRWIVSDDAPVALQAADDSETTPDTIRPGRVVLIRRGREQELYARWIASRDGTMTAAMLVPREGSPRVTVLTLDAMLTCSGIEGVLAHAVGRIDDDGLPDLMFLYDPCECSDDCPGGKGIVAEVYLTRGFDGLHSLSLGPRDELGALAARAFSTEGAWDALIDSTNWSIAITDGRAEIRFRGPTGIGQMWKLSLGPQDLDLSSTPLTESGN